MEKDYNWKYYGAGEKYHKDDEPLSSDAVLADVRAVLQEDYDKLNKMKSSKATGLFRAIYLLDEYISEHFS